MRKEKGPAPASGASVVRWFAVVTAILAGGAFLPSAHAEPVTVSSVGTGQSRQDAIDKALIQAVEQVTGVRLEAERNLSENLTTAIGPDVSATRVSASFQQVVRQKAGGSVERFTIVSVERDGAGFVARLEVSVERFVAPGLPSAERRRIIVAPPAVPPDTSSVEAGVFGDALIAHLTQTRRFAVLDRKADVAYRAEMQVLKSADVPVAEAARIGQVIGADYVVLPKLRRLAGTSETVTLPITGQRSTRTTTKATADFIVLDIATRQVKWAGQQSIEVSSDRDEALRGLAAAIGERIVGDIYPLRVVQVVDGKTLVLNQGAETIRIGQTFSVNRLGEMAIDPYTKEPLGRVEIPIGTVVVSRVDPKLSYAEFVAGAVAADETDIVLRTAAPVGAAADPTKTRTDTKARSKW